MFVNKLALQGPLEIFYCFCVLRCFSVTTNIRLNKATNRRFLRVCSPTYGPTSFQVIYLLPPQEQRNDAFSLSKNNCVLFEVCFFAVVYIFGEKCWLTPLKRSRFLMAIKHSFDALLILSLLAIPKFFCTRNCEVYVSGKS